MDEKLHSNNNIVIKEEIEFSSNKCISIREYFKVEITHRNKMEGE
jgi:hypothetical protein